MTDQANPLIRLRFLETFVRELQLKDVDVSAIFRTVGLDFTDFEDVSAFIPAAVKPPFYVPIADIVILFQEQ